jgi:LacI family transcriptional regulator
LIRSTVVGRSTLFRDLLIGIEDALAERDLYLTLARLPDQTLTEDNSVPKILREWMADGLLLNYHQDIPPRLQAIVEKHGLPSIWINSKHPTDCVYPADFETGRSATEHLLQMGHSRIAFATLRTTHYSAADWEGGYAQAMQQSGAVPRFCCKKPDALLPCRSGTRYCPCRIAPRQSSPICPTSQKPSI